MEAEEKAGRQEHLSKTVRLILDKCRTIAGEGRLVNMSVLKIVCPNHSNRDYVSAICSIFVHSFLFSPDHKFLL